MLTSYGSGGISPIGRPRTYYSNLKHNPVSQTGISHNYDFASFSSVPTGKSAFQMQMVGRLSQEVRASTTTGDIQELRQSVASGEYTPDPMNIAKSILFLTED